MCPFDESRLNREWVRLPRAPWTRPTDRQNAERRDRARAVATREGMTASSVDDFCHLPRDLSVGDVGGDVHCLQRALRRGDSSNVAPSGRFDEATREGVKRWTTANGWSNRTGSVDASVRSAYAEVRARRGDSRSFVVFDRAKTTGRTRRAQANDYATMSSGRLVNDCANGKNVDGLACVDVCAEFGEDSQFCRTKCAPRGDADKNTRVERRVRTPSRGRAIARFHRRARIIVKGLRGV